MDNRHNFIKHGINRQLIDDIFSNLTTCGSFGSVLKQLDHSAANVTEPQSRDTRVIDENAAFFENRYMASVKKNNNVSPEWFAYLAS